MLWFGVHVQLEFAIKASTHSEGIEARALTALICEIDALSI